jgi:hypothetical protein
MRTVEQKYEGSAVRDADVGMAEKATKEQETEN